MIPRILTMIPVRENSEVVIIYPDKYHIFLHLGVSENSVPQLPNGFHDTLKTRF